MTDDRLSKIYLIPAFRLVMAINNRVNAIPDLMPEAYKFTTFGDMKTIKKRGNI